MTSRDRLLAVLRGGVPDRVPVTLYEYSPYGDDWANREPSYAPLLDLEHRFGASFLFVPIDIPVLLGDPNVARGTEESAGDGTIVRTVQIETPRGPVRTITRRDPGLMTYWQVEPLIKSDEDIERVLSLPDPVIDLDPARVREWEARIGENGVALFSLGDAIGHVVGLFDFEDFVVRCLEDDAPIRALLDKAQRQVLNAIQAIGGLVKDACIRLWGPEYCGAPLMDPRIYFPRYVLPYDTEATRAIQATGNFSVIHCHGRLRDLLDMIADIGADALEPLEVLPMSTADVTLAEIKARIGERMCLMGAVQSLILETGTPEQMREAVRSAIAAAAPGGRFVLLPTAAPFMVPLDPRTLANAEAMFKAAHEFGSY
jgi:hypothetical protein